jgi:predicted Zn-dependent protease with MMP-like domain/Flp pilus assembly protein TadD
MRDGDDGRRAGDGAPSLDDLLDGAADAFEADDLDRALALADEACRKHPRSAAARHTRAATLAALGRLEDARAEYEEALSRDDRDLELLAAAADFHVNLAQEDEPDHVLAERGIELARRGAKLARRAGDGPLAGELAWLEAVGLGHLGRSREALARLAEAEEELPDSVDVLLEKGLALYELCDFDAARAALLRAEALDPDEPWTQHQLGLVAERRGDEREAKRRFKRARKLAPDEFPEPIQLPQAAFDAAVEDALAALPEPVRRYLSNVAITVEELPPDEELRASDPPLSPAILGLFRGAPYGQKASMDPWSHLPSAIVLYQKNLERFARSREELIDEIRVTLLHEVGHFLGLDEDELYERGLD